MGAWLRLVVLLGMGWGALRLGLGTRDPHLRGKLGRWCLALLGATVLSQVVYVLYAPWHVLAGPLVFALGGHAMVLCWLALALVGAVWSEPRRHISRDTLGLATGFVLVVHVLTAMTAVIWLYLPKAAANWPDEAGEVGQTTPFSCVAAAGAMLLAHEGVRVSEGQVAHWAGTSFAGTDTEGLRQALNHFGRPHGLRAVMDGLDLARAERLGRPFVATVNYPIKGLHALYVTHVGADGVDFVDPAGGQQHWTRQEFARRWFDVSVWLERR